MLTVEEDTGTGLSGKGSLTKAKLLEPSCILPFSNDQSETMNDWAPVEGRVAVGNGIDVLVVREYKEANCSTEAWNVAASVIGDDKAHST